MNPLHQKIFAKKYAHGDGQPPPHDAPQTAFNGTVQHEQQSYTQPAAVPNASSSGSRLQELSQNLTALNSSKLALRVSTDCFPSTKKLQKTLAIPLTLIVQPFASIYSYEEFPTANFGATNPIVRCDVCRSYVSPFTEFLEGGHRFKCNICGSLNATPHFYMAETDANGQRYDKFQRAELCCGTYDIKAGTDYMARPPMPPIYFFVVDVSQKAVENGSLEMFANVLNEIITNDWFWGDVRTKIGFIAYDTNVHIFNLDIKLKRPQLITLTDIDNLTKLPVPENLLVTLSDSKELVKSVIKTLPTMFANTKDAGSSLINALRVSTSILRASGGRIYIIQSNPNIVAEPGLSIKGPPSAQDKKVLMTPTTPKVMELTVDMQQNFISCNLFILSNTYKNSVTMGDLARYLNGDIHYFPEGPERNHRFYYELKNSIMREYTWETVFRLRVSQGWNVKKIYGNYSIKFSNDLLSVPNVDDTKAIVYEVELDDEISRFNCFYLQTALLYTNSYGERRIRVINYGIPLSDNLSDVEQYIDPQVLLCTLLRYNLDKMYNKPSITQVRDECLVKARMIYNQVTKSKHNNEGMPESMITFSLGVLGLLKHPLFLEQQWQYNVETDFRNALRIKLNMLNIDETMLYFVPYLFAVHRLVEDGDVAIYDENGAFVYPQLINLSMSALANNGIYLMDDGFSLYMLVGSQVDPSILKNMLGINSIEEVESLNEDMLYHNSSDPLVERLYYLITELRNKKSDRYAYLYIIKEGEKSPAEFNFYSKLIEDKLEMPNAYKMSYNDFINVLSMPVVGSDKI